MGSQISTLTFCANAQLKAYYENFYIYLYMREFSKKGLISATAHEAESTVQGVLCLIRGINLFHPLNRLIAQRNVTIGVTR